MGWVENTMSGHCLRHHHGENAAGVARWGQIFPGKYQERAAESGVFPDFRRAVIPGMKESLLA